MNENIILGLVLVIIGIIVPNIPGTINGNYSIRQANNLCGTGLGMINKFSMDGFCPELSWIRIDLKELYTKHVSYDNKRRRINKISSKKKVVGKRLKEKYSKREKNVCSQIVHKITNITKSLGIKHGFEDLSKQKMYRKSRKWNRELGYNNWSQITNQMDYKSDIKYVNPYHTSKDCSRCGWTNKDLRGEKFECVNKDCGLVINRQFNAGINVLGMEGLPHNIRWFDDNVIKPLDKSLNIMNEFTQTGAERKEADELVRPLYDLMKPQFYGV